jgi:hypothetical protein
MTGQHANAETTFREVSDKDSGELIRLESERLRRELEIATRYWQKTILRHVTRYMPDPRRFEVEVFIAEHAYDLLKSACEEAANWNSSHEGRAAAIPLPELSGASLCYPDFLYAEDFPGPEVLAGIAAPLLPANGNALFPRETVLRACELYVAARDYLSRLPKTPGEGWETGFRVAMSEVSVTEIHKSNQSNSRRLPLLPALQVKRKGKTNAEVTGAQTAEAILDAMIEYQQKRIPNLTEEQYNKEAEQEEALVRSGIAIRFAGADHKPTTYQEWQAYWQKSIDDLRATGRMPLLSICTLRWERFRDKCIEESNKAKSREERKRVTKRNGS